MLCCCVCLQYHALGLLYHIRKPDKLAVSKLVTKFTRHPLKSPYAYCHLVRLQITLLLDQCVDLYSLLTEGHAGYWWVTNH